MLTANLRSVLCAVLLFNPSSMAAAEESLILGEITVRGERQAPNEEMLTIREVRERPARDLGEAL